MKTLHLYRPGAIGDIIVSLQAIEKYKRLHPEDKIVYYCAPEYKEVPLISSAISEVRSSLNWFKDDVENAQALYGYTANPMLQHLMWYFGKELGVDDTFYNYGFVPKFLSSNNNLVKIVTECERNYFITIHTTAGWSPYKNWNISRWQDIVNRCSKQYPQNPVIQIGSVKDTPLKDVADWRGKLSIVECIQVIKRAKLHLGIDSFSNHATALLPLTPSVILWGSTHPANFGYGHNTNIWKPTKCNPCNKLYDWITKTPQTKCILDSTQSYENPKHPCMDNITVEEVWSAIEKKLNV